ncbi:MAG: hypothetical protein VX672_09360 [Planctomycetota bacterium]|nr:hypothetical protein [Planctomycetota bacterium]
MEMLIGIVVFMLVAVAAVHAFLQERKRTTELQDLAERMGLSFSPARDSSADERFARFGPFKRGHSRRAWNIMRGMVTLGGYEMEVESGDFRYTVGTGRDRRTYKFSYLVGTNPIGACPETIVRKEGVFDQLKGVLGFDDIDFESDEFSRRYHVSSDEKRFAYDLIDQRMIEYLMATSPPAFELDGDLICVSDGRARWRAEDFQQWFDWLGGFLRTWPDHLAHSIADRGD